MNRFRNLLLGVFLLQVGVVLCAPKERRWIPERMSDNDYGLDTHSFSSGDPSDGSNQPNYLSYWSDYVPGGYHGGGNDYSGMFYRARQDPAPQAVMDPVQQLQNVQAYSYAQGLQQMYPYGYPYGYYPAPPPSASTAGYYPGEPAPTGRALLNLGSTSHSHPASTSHLASKQPTAVFLQNPSQQFLLAMPNNPQRQNFFLNQFMPQSALQQHQQFMMLQQPQIQQTSAVVANPASQSASTLATLAILNEVLDESPQSESTSDAIVLNFLNQGSSSSLENALLEVNALNSEAVAQESEVKDDQSSALSPNQIAMLLALMNQNAKTSAVSSSAQNVQLAETLLEAEVMDKNIEAAEELLDNVNNQAVKQQQAQSNAELIAAIQQVLKMNQNAQQEQSVLEQIQKEVKQQSQEQKAEAEAASTQTHQSSKEQQSHAKPQKHSSSHNSKKDNAKQKEQQQKEQQQKEQQQKAQSQVEDSSTAENQRVVKAEIAQVEVDSQAESEASAQQAAKTTETEEEVVVVIVEDEVKDKEQKAQRVHEGRAHDIYGTNNTDVYNSSPLDQIYPGVMQPTPYKPSVTYPTVYGQYPPQTTTPSSSSSSSSSTPATTPTNPYYGATPTYQRPQYYTPNPYAASQQQMGSPYATPSAAYPSQYPGYPSQPASSPSYSSSSGYYGVQSPPRVTRNSGATGATPFAAKYPYGGSHMYPQFG